MSKNRVLFVLLAVLLVLTVVLPVAASPDSVIKKTRIEDFAFVPNRTQGCLSMDQFGWKNFGPSPHTVTSDTGAFDSGTMNVNDLFLFTPTTTGIFTYHCTFHPTMTGGFRVNNC